MLTSNNLTTGGGRPPPAKRAWTHVPSSTGSSSSTTAARRSSKSWITVWSQQNQAAKMIGALMGQASHESRSEKKAEVAALKEKSVKLSAEMKQTADALQAEIVLLPNFPAEIVPRAKSRPSSLVVKLVENYTPLPAERGCRTEAGKKYDIIDFDLGVKLTGADFRLHKGKGARLQRALINYFLDYNTRAGYQEVEPPVMVNEASGFGTGQLPDKEGQMYHATVD